MAAAPGNGNDGEEAVDFGDPFVIAVTQLKINVADAPVFEHLDNREDPAKPRTVWCLDAYVYVESQCLTPSSQRQKQWENAGQCATTNHISLLIAEGQQSAKPGICVNERKEPARPCALRSIRLSCRVAMSD